MTWLWSLDLLVNQFNTFLKVLISFKNTQTKKLWTFEQYILYVEQYICVYFQLTQLANINRKTNDKWIHKYKHELIHTMHHTTWHLETKIFFLRTKQPDKPANVFFFNQGMVSVKFILPNDNPFPHNHKSYLCIFWPTFQSFLIFLMTETLLAEL